jgi:transcriptional regulator with XRE-family HTH domain
MSMAKDIRIQFSNRLRKLRTDAGMTQEELARKAGISVKYLQNLESDEPKNPTLVSLEKIAKGLNMALKELF